MSKNRSRSRPTVAYTLDPERIEYVRKVADRTGLSASFVVDRMVAFFVADGTNLLHTILVSKVGDDTEANAA